MEQQTTLPYSSQTSYSYGTTTQPLASSGYIYSSTPKVTTTEYTITSEPKVTTTTTEYTVTTTPKVTTEYTVTSNYGITTYPYATTTSGTYGGTYDATKTSGTYGSAVDTYGATKTSGTYGAAVDTYGATRTSGAYGTASGTYGTTSGTYGTGVDTYGATKTSGTYGTYGTGVDTYGATRTSGTYGTASGTYGATRASGTFVTPTKAQQENGEACSCTHEETGRTSGVYTKQNTSTSGIYSQSYAGPVYQPIVTYISGACNENEVSSVDPSTQDSPYNDFLANLRTSIIHEIKTNIESRGPQFGKDLRRHIESNVVGTRSEVRPVAVVDTLRAFNLVTVDKLSDPNRIWLNAQPAYTSYNVSTSAGTSYQSPYKGSEANKRSMLPDGTTRSQVLPKTLLSPYRQSMYPEFDIVEDLPDRTNLLNSINYALQRSSKRESLLISPSKVSIKRSTILSPAEILVHTLLKEKCEDGSVYEGEGRNGVRHGRGKVIYRDGRTFRGEFVDGKAHGTGAFSYKTGKLCYEGGIVNGQYEGQGVLQCETPTPIQGAIDYRNFGALGDSWARYEGEFKNGKRHGNGTLHLTNGERFVGEFRDDQAHGRGAFYQRDGRVIEGNWDRNTLVGSN